MSLVEEWFSRLERTPLSRLNKTLLSNSNLVRTVLNQIGRFGMASFLIALAAFSDPSNYSVPYFLIAIGIGLMVWAALIIFESSVNSAFYKRLSRNLIPSIILLNPQDDRAYKEISDGRIHPATTLTKALSAAVSGILLNVLASYIYSYLQSS